LNVDALELTLRIADRRAAEDEAFERLVRQHERRVLNTAWRMLGRIEDAQDASQEVFLRLFRNLGKLDGAARSAWLYRVTVNVCLDLAKRRGRLPPEVPGHMETASTDPGPEETSATARKREWMRKALLRLPEKERAALVLREIEGLTTAEVSEILGSSETTVRSQICSARMKLRKLAVEGGIHEL